MSAIPLAVALMSALGFAVSGLLGAFGSVLGARVRTVGPAIAGGMLLAVGFGRVFPEAVSRDAAMAAWGFAGGFVTLLLVEAFSRSHTHHLDDGDVTVHSLRPFLIGLAIHNAADGLVVGLGAQLPSTVASAIGVGVLVHQVPVGLSVTIVLTTAGLTIRRTVYAVLLLAAAIPVTTLAVVLLVPAGGDALVGGLLGAAAGVLTYLSASHLLPEVQREQHSAVPAITFAAVTITTVALLQTVLSG